MASPDIQPSEASQWSETGKAVIIDVRTPPEFEALHAISAVNLPLDSLNEQSIKAAGGLKKILFICQSGTRGGKACAVASNFGISASNISGGTAAWAAAGLPVKRGESAVSLERQVRICAGALVALGTLGAIFSSSAFLAIPLFVGCGLVFAGVTNTCTMGMLLAKMPWNNKVSHACQVVVGKV